MESDEQVSNGQITTKDKHLKHSACYKRRIPVQVEKKEFILKGSVKMK